MRNPLYKTPEIALVNAGRCSASFGDNAAAEQFFKRALGASPGNPNAAYGLALLAYAPDAYDEARGWLRPAVLQANPAPERSTSACASSARRATRRRRRRSHRSSRTAIRTRLKHGHSPPESASDRTSDASRREAPSTTPRNAGATSAGALLREAREAAGMSIDAVAQQLKLAPRQVQALEDGDFAHLPGRTFVRGFMRNYARLRAARSGCGARRAAGSAARRMLDSPALHTTAQTMGELPTTEAPRHSWTRWAIPLTLIAIIGATAAWEWMHPAPPNRSGARSSQPPHPNGLPRRAHRKSSARPCLIRPPRRRRRPNPSHRPRRPPDQAACAGCA